MKIAAETVLGWLKAAGEDSRLRLLALCARREMSVSDLADLLRQSEPRVSRHLKILLEAGLLERLRQGQWVHYRLTRDAMAAGFVQGLLALIAPAGREGGQVSRSGGSRLGKGVGPRMSSDAATGSGRASESRLGRALKEFVEAVEVDVALGGGVVGSPQRGAVAGGATDDEVRTAGWPGDRSRALVVGVEHLEALEMAAATAEECVAIAHSRRAAQSAKAFVERLGLPCRVLLAAGSSLLCEKDIEAAGAPFDRVFLDHLAVPDSPLEALLSYGRRALAQGGRLWLFERYESLESSRDKVVEHPIGRLRRLCADADLTCERLSPIESDGEHVLAAVAVPARAASLGAGAAGAA